MMSRALRDYTLVVWRFTPAVARWLDALRGDGAHVAHGRVAG